MCIARWRVLAPLFLSLSLAGCQYVPVGQVTSLETQNRNLTEQSKAQLAELENLKTHARQLEDRLIQAEEQLAVSDQKLGTDRRQLANFRRERQQLQEQFGAAGSATLPSALSAKLADLARANPCLQFDPHTGIAKLDTDVLFDSGEAQLKPEADNMLKDFAAIFQSPEAQDMKLMIVGHADGQKIARKQLRQQHPDNWHLSTARSLAVANALRQAGLREDRMGVAGFSSQQPISPNSTAADRRRNRRVEIFVVPPDTPIVGWTESATTLY